MNQLSENRQSSLDLANHLGGVQNKTHPSELQVLIVEDSSSDAELLLMRLKSEGFRLKYRIVETEKDYISALDQPFDLILSDWVLPQFSGLRALQHMRARDLDTPFIIISGTISEDAATEALRLGAYDYLMKDRVHRLGNAVLNALDQKKLRDERKQAEKMLQLQASALNAAPNAIVITNASGAIEWSNPAFTMLTGYSAAEALGKNLHELVKTDEHEPAFFLHMRETILAGDVWRGETINQRKNGTLYTEEMTITPIRDSAGGIRQFIAIKEDVTQQKLTKKILEARIHLHESSAHLNLEALLRATLDEAEKLTESHIGFYHILSSDEQTISLEAWSTQTLKLFCKVQRVDPHYNIQQAGVWADCIRERKVVVHNRFSELLHRKGMPAGHAAIEREIVVPVFRKAKIVAVMGVGNKLTDYTDTDIQILDQLSDFSWDVIEKKISLEKSTEELKTAYDATLQGWSNALELREQETAGHSQRVVQTTLKLARQMAVSEENLLDIQRGALLHDIGKMGIPDNILLKTGPLNEEEWLTMRKHPEYAHRLLSIIPYLKQALEIPYFHHEKWDGTGYPWGLKGEEIPLAARIFSIVDVWDALSYDRPYRKAWPKETIMNYIQEQSGKYFDPRVVEEFLSLMSKAG